MPSDDRMAATLERFQRLSASVRPLVQRRDAAGVEMAAARLLVLAEPHIAADRAGLSRLLVEAVQEPRDPLAAALLVGLACVGDESVATAAADAVDALRRADILPSLHGHPGSAAVASACRQVIVDQEIITVELRREDVGSVQLAWFLLAGSGRALLSGELSAPGDVGAALQALRAPESVAEDLRTEDLHRILRQGAAATRRTGAAVALETAAAHYLVCLALGHRMRPLRARDDAIPPAHMVPATVPTSELYAVMNEVLSEFADWTARMDGFSGPTWRSGDFVGGAMIEYKAKAGKGPLLEWSTHDIRDFMLRWFPRSVHAPPEVIDDLPRTMAAFLRFLEHRGSVQTDQLLALELATQAAVPGFRRAMADSASWSPTKRRVVEALESDCAADK